MFLTLIDLETTGLCPGRNQITEFACMVIDSVTGHEITRWTTPVFNEVTLVWDKECEHRAATHVNQGLSLKHVECHLHAISSGYKTLMGKQIENFDMKFLEHYMPGIRNCFKHRSLDLGSMFFDPLKGNPSMDDIATLIGAGPVPHTAMGDVELYQKAYKWWLQNSNRG